jgi:hypothetical protein
MTREFAPNINRKIFADTILQIQDNEGNNVTVVRAIQSKIADYKGAYLYDAFINICKEYKIDFQCYEICNENLSSFKIVTRQNQHEDYTLSYRDRDKDIASDLARQLYSTLAVQILNDTFIKSVKE